jgi:hypothetical protein
MVGITNEDPAADLLFLEVALQTQRGIALVEHSGIDRAVRRMATQTTFSEGFVFEHEWTALGGMALETSFVLAQ